MKFHNRFKNCIRRKGSFLCVGIDPDPMKIPPSFSRTPDGILKFVREVICATKDIVPAYKFNLAFFELWGWKGWQILEKILSEISDDVLLIGDAKRGDIGNSSRFYAESLFSTLCFDAVTLSPYLGSDSITPFINDDSKGAFVLCVTSNPSGQELQNHGGNEPLYLRVAELVQSLNSRKNLGLVIGATKPEQLRKVRSIYPELPFLIPGVGKQGGAVESATEVCRNCGLGLINVSRSVIFPAAGEFPKNVRESAKYYSSLFKIEETK